MTDTTSNVASSAFSHRLMIAVNRSSTKCTVRCAVLIRALLCRTFQSPFQTALVIVYTGADLLLHVALVRFLSVRQSLGRGIQ
jgi:uncharacterized membrane protein YdfJ with MMPL/SSD domain